MLFHLHVPLFRYPFSLSPCPSVPASANNDPLLRLAPSPRFSNPTIRDESIIIGPTTLSDDGRGGRMGWRAVPEKEEGGRYIDIFVRGQFRDGGRQYYGNHTVIQHPLSFIVSTAARIVGSPRTARSSRLYLILLPQLSSRRFAASLLVNRCRRTCL